MILRIADLNIELLGFDSIGIKDKLVSYQPDCDGSADMTIMANFAEKIPSVSGKSTDCIEGWRWCTGDGNEMIWYCETKDGEIFSRIDFQNNYKTALITLSEKEFKKRDELVYLLLRQTVWLMLTAFDAVVIHSSAICCGGQALLFSAPSGTGKSTQTQMWIKEFPDDVMYINDDTPIIRKKNGVFYVYGAPWSGKNSINNPISAPLKGIVCVRQSKENHIKRLSGFEVFYRLYNESKKPIVKELTEKYMNIISEIAESVKVVQLECYIDKATVYMIKEEFNL